MVPYCKILTILNYFYPHLVKITFKIQDSEVLFLTCSHNMCSEMHGGRLLRLCLKDLGAIKKKLIRVRIINRKSLYWHMLECVSGLTDDYVL